MANIHIFTKTLFHQRKQLDTTIKLGKRLYATGYWQVTRCWRSIDVLHILIILLGLDLNYSYELQVVLADSIYLEAESVTVVSSINTRCQHANVVFESVTAFLPGNSLWIITTKSRQTLLCLPAHIVVHISLQSDQNVFRIIQVTYKVI